MYDIHRLRELQSISKQAQLNCRSVVTVVPTSFGLRSCSANSLILSPHSRVEQSLDQLQVLFEVIHTTFDLGGKDRH